MKTITYTDITDYSAVSIFVAVDRGVVVNTDVFAHDVWVPDTEWPKGLPETIEQIKDFLLKM